MISSLDIWKSARIMIERYGGQSAVEAGRRARQFEDHFEEESGATWRLVALACEHLLSLERPGPAEAAGDDRRPRLGEMQLPGASPREPFPVSPSTRRAYEGAWRRFRLWAEANGVDPMPTAPAVLGRYLTVLADAGRSVATIQLAKAAVRHANRLAGHRFDARDPAVAGSLRGVRPTTAARWRGRAPLAAAALRRVVAELPDTPRGRRDRAIILLTLHAGRRQSEIGGLDLGPDQTADSTGHLAFGPGGPTVVLRRPRAGRAEAGADVPLKPTADPVLCPVRALEEWIAAAELSGGSVFRAISDRDLAG